MTLTKIRRSSKVSLSMSAIITRETVENCIRIAEPQTKVEQIAQTSSCKWLKR
jgi:hypothetical protein